MCDTTVTINYEDREQVERMLRGYWLERDKETGLDSSSPRGLLSFIADDCIRDMQAALREFADPKPPKCGVAVTFDFPDGKGVTYKCAEPDGHEGHHRDADGVGWRAPLGVSDD